MKTQSRIWRPSPGGSMRFWNPLERQFSLRLSRMSKQCLSTSEYRLQVRLSHLPFTTHSLKEFYTDLISNGWSCAFLAQFPKHWSSSCHQCDFFFSPHFCTCVSREYEISFVCLALQNSN